MEFKGSQILWDDSVQKNLEYNISTPMTIGPNEITIACFYKPSKANKKEKIIVYWRPFVK